MQNKSIFSGLSKQFIAFSLGGLLVISGGAFAAVNSGISLPPIGSAGDIITVEYWNQLVNGTRELDNRTKEIHSDENGNVVVGGFNKSDTDNYTAPAEQLDVRGAIKIGDTTSENSGTIRFNESVSDFQGYTGEEWKSLTSGEGGTSGGECTTQESSLNFAVETESVGSGIVQASCESGTISYASVEWADKPGIYSSSLALQTSANGTSASINTLGNPAKIHLVCCAGGAGSGGANDELAQLKCAEGNIPKWSDSLRKWSCAVDNGGNSPWSQLLSNTYITEGNVGIGVDSPQAKLEILDRTNSQIVLANRENNKWGLRVGNTGSLIFRNNGVERVRFNENGNAKISGDITTSKINTQTETGTNSEISLQSGEKDKWAIYHDENTEELRFWNVNNLITFFTNGNVEISGNVKSAPAPIANEDLANKQYVDAQVSAGSDWQKNTFCADTEKFLGFENGVAKCVEDTGGTANSNTDVSVSFRDGATDGNGNYFAVGGNPHFCTKYSVNSEGTTTSTNINNYKKSNEEKLCWDGKERKKLVISVNNPIRNEKPVNISSLNQVCIEALSEEGYILLSSEASVFDIISDEGIIKTKDTICKNWKTSGWHYGTNCTSYADQSLADWNKESGNWEINDYTGSASCTKDGCSRTNTSLNAETNLTKINRYITEARCEYAVDEKQ